MDPATHTLSGVALARTGLREATPLATAALVIAANIADIDGVFYIFGNGYDALAHRRGWTHGPLGLALLPFLTTGAVLAWDRWVRRRRDPDAPPARPAPLLLLALLGVLTHPLLDWMNTYGVRLLMPFSERWFYGDALFIIDPWVLIGLGCAVYLSGRIGRNAARWGLGLVTAYIALMVIGSAAAERWVRAETVAAAEEVRRVMVGPVPVNPFVGQVIVETPDAYLTGTFRWTPRPQLVLDGPRLPVPPEAPGWSASRAAASAVFGIDAIAVSAVAEAHGVDEIVTPVATSKAPDAIAAAAATPEARDFLTWARFPWVVVDTLPTGYLVRIGDARYLSGHAGALSGLEVRLDAELRPVGR